MKYLKLTGRPEEQLALVETYAKEQGLWHDPDRPSRATPSTSSSTWPPSCPRSPGPKRPQDRVSLSNAKQAFRGALADYVETPTASGARRGTTRLGRVLPGLRRPGLPRRQRRGGSDRRTCPPRPTDGGRPSDPIDGHARTARSSTLDHGAVTIAAITSCTNTSNPSVMIGAALLAKKAVEKGLTSKPWVKTTLAPGSKVVSDYYEKSGLTPYLDKLGLQPRRLRLHHLHRQLGSAHPRGQSAAVQENDLAVVSVLSGNRNFEGRINPDVKMNYLASPPLVVAYALAGSMDVDLFNEPLGQDQRRQRRVHEGHLADGRGGRGRHRRRDHLGDVHHRLRRRLRR